MARKKLSPPLVAIVAPLGVFAGALLWFGLAPHLSAETHQAVLDVGRVYLTAYIAFVIWMTARGTALPTTRRKLLRLMGVTYVVLGVLMCALAAWPPHPSWPMVIESVCWVALGVISLVLAARMGAKAAPSPAP